MNLRESLNDETTRRPVRKDVQVESSLVVLLTILAHPDPRRVGERAALIALSQGKTLELGRHAPRFSPLGSPWVERSLEDSYLSRNPWTMTPVDQGVELTRGGSSTELRLDGVVVDEVALVPAESLRLGVTLELSDRVALLLHRMPESLFTAADAEWPEGEMVGAAAGILRVREAVDRVADLGVPVLIRGESGTGKELVAKALHRRSRRSKKPFMAVDLGVLSPALAAAELFGHAKGAFTGADSAREGFFRAAAGGTLFLDEVGEATGEVQAMLLRVLEAREVVPVGSHRPVAIDVRLIAATDSDLVARARRGDFKEPLLHRLAAYVVELPPLRERREDIGRLFVHLARPVLRELDEEELLDRPAVDGPPWMPADLIARLARETWTGNVRQLANVVRQLVIDSRGGERLRISPQIHSSLVAEAVGVQTSPEMPASPRSSGASETVALETAASETAPIETPAAEERGYRRPSEVTDDEVIEAMQSCGFEPAAAARFLGIRRPSLYKLVRRNPTLRLAPDIPAEELAEVLATVNGRVADAAELLSVSKRALGRRLTDLGMHPEDPKATAEP